MASILGWQNPPPATVEIGQQPGVIFRKRHPGNWATQDLQHPRRWTTIHQSVCEWVCINSPDWMPGWRWTSSRSGARIHPGPGPGSRYAEPSAVQFLNRLRHRRFHVHLLRPGGGRDVAADPSGEATLRRTPFVGRTAVGVPPPAVGTRKQNGKAAAAIHMTHFRYEWLCCREYQPPGWLPLLGQNWVAVCTCKRRRCGRVCYF